MANQNCRLRLSKSKQSEFLMYEIFYIHEHRSALPAAVQTLSPDAFEVTNALLRKCQEYYKVGELVVEIPIKQCSC